MAWDAFAPVQLAPDVWSLPLRRVNAYALKAAEGTVLVDAGNPGDGPRVLTMLQVAGLEPPALILLTHADVDHAGGVRDLLRACAPRVLAAGPEALVLAGRGRPRLLRRLGRLGSGRVRCSATVRDGECVAGLTVVSTPGHTRGHCSYLRESDGLLFTGDALAVRDGMVRIPGQPFTEDWPRAYASLARLVSLHPRLLLPGHGAPLAEPDAALQLALKTERAPRRRLS